MLIIRIVVLIIVVLGLLLLFSSNGPLKSSGMGASVGSSTITAGNTGHVTTTGGSRVDTVVVLAA